VLTDLFDGVEIRGVKNQIAHSSDKLYERFIVVNATVI